MTRNRERPAMRAAPDVTQDDVSCKTDARFAPRLAL
jgi:hypothetical protein